MKLAVGLLALMLMATPVGANDPLKMYLSIGAAVAPANVYIQTILERSEQHRSIQIVTESEVFYSSSSVSLDGDRAPRMNTFKIAQLPAGHYNVVASVFGSDGKAVARAREWFDIR